MKPRPEDAMEEVEAEAAPKAGASAWCRRETRMSFLGVSWGCRPATTERGGSWGSSRPIALAPAAGAPI